MDREENFRLSIHKHAIIMPRASPATCAVINLSVAHVAAGSQFVLKLTGGVTSIEITRGAIHVETTAPVMPKPKQTLKILCMTN